LQKVGLAFNLNNSKRLGVIGDWSNYYSTMSNDAEAQIALEILKFLKNGSLYKGYKPVLWSVVEATALADAEVEYQDHVSNQIYVKFPLQQLYKGNNNIFTVIWTTTPWTIPCNRALAYNVNLKYGIFENEKKEKLLIAEDLLQNFQETTKVKLKKIDAFEGKELKNLTANHPLKDLGYNFNVPFLEADFVTTDQGTGIVHVAPSHGPDDFMLGLKNNIPAENTINDSGYYTDIIKHFSGTHIFKADKVVISELEKFDALIFTDKYKHSYPHSWRSKAPLVHRATPQWFISMEKNSLREIALKNIDQTNFFPSIGKNRIKGMIETRPDWCISRQRFWGVPLPIFLNKKTDEPLIDDEINSKIFEIFSNEGSDAWYTKSIEDFIGHKYNSEEFKKVSDIVEVWFDSGSSHSYVLEKRAELSWPADMYLEGSDQHRGWFHSSLLQSSGTRGIAPYKSILTHGFVVDGKGQKMSKSVGNVIAPEEIIKKNGSDILRLWVVASDYSEDLKIDPSIISQHSESYRKIRNTFRFILGNIRDDFSFKKINSMKFENQDIIDTFIIEKISRLDQEFVKYVTENDYHRIYVELLNFCTNDLSALYFDIKKDILYCDDIESNNRKNCIKVLKFALYFLLKWLNPILTFTTEEIYQILKLENKNSDYQESIFLEDFDNLNLEHKIYFNENSWEVLKKIKSEVNQLVEDMRNKKLIKSNLETNITIMADPNYKKVFQDVNLSEFFVCSDANVLFELNNNLKEFTNPKGFDDIKIRVEKAEGEKCSHCWKILSKPCLRKNCAIK
jgi:isoleucyl-tRNA synthetase